ncbi:MAG: clan AA aspartic protease [Candidatus Thioglobus sp.]|nr:clan AA aspartic protease [Candidatus Thioglobus sp.]
MSFLANNINWKPQFDKLQAQLNYALIFQQGEVAIPLIKLPRAWHIKVLVNGVAARFILDTGATTTVVNENLIGNNYKHLGKITISTANGLAEAFQAEISDFTIGEIIKKSFIVVVTNKAKLPAGIDGLLGLDWLSNFDFVIDEKNSLLRLSAKVN